MKKIGLFLYLWAIRLPIGLTTWIVLLALKCVTHYIEEYVWDRFLHDRRTLCSTHEWWEF